MLTLNNLNKNPRKRNPNSEKFAGIAFVYLISQEKKIGKR